MAILYGAAQAAIVLICWFQCSLSAQPVNPITVPFTTPLWPCYSVYKLPKAPAEHLFLYSSFYFNNGWSSDWGTDERLDCVFIFEAPARSHLSLELINVTFADGNSGNCSTGAVRIYNYMTNGQLNLSNQICANTNLSKATLTPTNTAVVTSTVNQGDFCVRVSVLQGEGEERKAGGANTPETPTMRSTHGRQTSPTLTEETDESTENSESAELKPVADINEPDPHSTYKSLPTPVFPHKTAFIFNIDPNNLNRTNGNASQEYTAIPVFIPLRIQGPYRPNNPNYDNIRINFNFSGGNGTDFTSISNNTVTNLTNITTNLFENKYPSDVLNQSNVVPPTNNIISSNNQSPPLSLSDKNTHSQNSSTFTNIPISNESVPNQIPTAEVSRQSNFSLPPQNIPVLMQNPSDEMHNYSTPVLESPTPLQNPPILSQNPSLQNQNPPPINQNIGTINNNSPALDQKFPPVTQNPTSSNQNPPVPNQNSSPLIQNFSPPSQNILPINQNPPPQNQNSPVPDQNLSQQAQNSEVIKDFQKQNPVELNSNTIDNNNIHIQNSPSPTPDSKVTSPVPVKRNINRISKPHVSSEGFLITNEI